MGLFSSPKGGSSKSGNQAYPYLMSNFGGWAPAGTNSLGAMSSLLGLGGMGAGPTAGMTIDMAHDGIDDNKGLMPGGKYTIPGAPGAYGSGGAAGAGGGMGGGAMGGFNNFLDSSAYNFIKDEAMSGLTNSAAGQGMLRSGATAKALQDRAANIGKTYFDNYLNHLTDVSKLGLGAGGLISGAGNWSKSKGPTQGGMGMDLLGAGLQILPALFA